METTSRFLHTVFFWLRENSETQDAERLAQGCLHHLSNIPGVVRLSVGYPAGTEREVVDNSYGVGLLVEFADAQSHDVYQDHAQHLQFIEECGKYWSRVQVYDTVELPK